MKAVSLFFCTILGLGWCALVSPAGARAGESREGTWVTRSPMPTPRQEIYPACLDGRIYAVGGFTASATSCPTVEVYLPGADVWQTRPDLLDARHHIFTVALDGLLYAMGGFAGNGWQTAGEMYVFDPAADAWSRGASMVSERGEHVAAVFGGLIYVFGGRDRGLAVTPTTQVYSSLKPADVRTSRNWGRVTLSTHFS